MGSTEPLLDDGARKTTKLQNECDIKPKVLNEKSCFQYEVQEKS